jgi:hypothetical protein
VLSDAV